MDYRVAVVLPAGGTGQRMESSCPKQYTEIQGRPLISYTIEAFERLKWIDSVTVCVSKENLARAEEICLKFQHCKTKVVLGANTRHRSIWAGLKSLSEDNECKLPDVVIIHDAVRPFVDEDIVSKVSKAAYEVGASGAIRPLVSTVIATDQEGYLLKSLDRNVYRASEMPQGFIFDLILNAYQKCTDFDLDYGTECLHLIQKYMNVNAKLIEGPSNLWKVTYPKDLFAAEALLKEQMNVAEIHSHLPISDRLRSSLEEKKIKVVKSKANNIIFVSDELNKDFIKQMADEKQKQIVDHRSGGCLVFIINSDYEIFWQFKEILLSISQDLKEKRTAVYGILMKDLKNSKTEEMAADLIWERNLNFSGQIFLT